MGGHRMKAYVITHSSTYEERAEAVGCWMKEQGVDVTWVFADFDHRILKNVPRREQDHVYLHMAPYSSNLSPGRIRSIREFAREVEKYLTGRAADLLYFMIPANSFVPTAKRLKKLTGAKIVLDIIDLWPESLPLPHADKLLPVYAWKQLRDHSIGCADLIFTECGLYQDLLPLPKDKTKTLYWFHKGAAAVSEDTASVNPTDAVPVDDDPGMSGQNISPEDGCLHIAYIGAINHIIDIRAIAELLKKLQREQPVVLDVIGYGRKKEEFLEALDEAGIQSEDYGAVFDEEEKAEIFSRCSFGINMMVPEVRVGLTMKSLDYLAYGLPLLNNIGGDTWELVEEYDAGVNIPRENVETVIPRILAMAKDPLAAEDARRLFEERFTTECFRNTLQEKLGPILRECETESIRRENKTGPGGGSEAAAQPLVSVVMAACNGEKYLPEQLDSILSQIGEDDEVVVSVDPSQDRTFEILFEYAAKDARIRVLEGPGEGVIRNVEHALQSSSGRLIFLADQDDVWMPDKVEKVCRTLEHNTLVLHDAQIVDENLDEISPSFMSWRRSRKGMLANIRKNSYIGCCMAFRRELLEYILPFPEKLPMHDQWIGLLAEKHGSARLLRVPLIRYRRHGANATKQTHANAAQMLKWRAEITREVLKR